MMKLEATEWPSRLDALSLKEVHLFYELSKLNQSIGFQGEEVLPASASKNVIHRRRSKKRHALSERIWKDICMEKGEGA